MDNCSIDGITDKSAPGTRLTREERRRMAERRARELRARKRRERRKAGRRRRLMVSLASLLFLSLFLSAAVAVLASSGEGTAYISARIPASNLFSFMV
jgi:hypothetical protein